MYKPIYLVTQYKNVKRESQANKYSVGEKLDLWKVGMIHGYYTGMGIDFFFPDEPDASRFTPWTIYDPGQIIEAMENRKFTVKGIKKTMQMSGRNKYTHHRSLVDAWIVQFEGERNDAIDVWHPHEASARRYSFGKSYSTADILGTTPAIPRDVAALLEEIARRAAAEEEERRRREEEAKNPTTPTTPPTTPPPTGGGSTPEVPTVPPPPPPPTGPTLTERQNAAVARWWTISNGGKAGYYAAVNVLLYTPGATYAQTNQRGGFTLFSTGSFTRGVYPLVWGLPTTIAGTSIYFYQWFGFYIEP
jgi:hypothetical protein